MVDVGGTDMHGVIEHAVGCAGKWARLAAIAAAVAVVPGPAARVLVPQRLWRLQIAVLHHRLLQNCIG